MNSKTLIKIYMFIFIIFLSLLLIPIFHYFKKYELFTIDIPASFNARINYKNKGVDKDLPWNHHIISSVYPHEINYSSKTKFYYDFSNKEYENKLRKIFYDNTVNNLIKYVEGIEWGDWVYPEKFKNKEYLLSEYQKIYDLIYTKINESDELKLNDETDLYKIQIVHDVFKRYRLNKNNSGQYMFDIDLLLYKESKLNGKHINLLVIIDGIKITFVLIKLIGVVHQDNIYLFPVLSNEVIDDNTGFTPYISKTDLKKYLSSPYNEESYYSLNDNDANNNFKSTKSQISVGASDMYIPVCRHHYNILSKV
jgi:hypothetical protein